MKQVIAVDIDDVLVDHYEELVKFHNERYGTKHTIKDYHTDHWSGVWGTPHEETERRAKEFAALGVHNRRIKQGALDAVKKLHQSHDLVIVTARRKVNVKQTELWLKENFPDTFREIHFLPIWEEDIKQTKADICLAIGADFLIDDSLKHCTIAAECGLAAILFGDYPWNQSQVLPQGVKRVTDWNSVLEYFDGKNRI